MSECEVIIASCPDKERVVAEIHIRGEHWGTASYEPQDEEPTIEVPDWRRDRLSRRQHARQLKLHELENALRTAREELVGG